MPKVSFPDSETYGRALEVLLDLDNSTYVTRPDRIVVVDNRQLRALIERDLVPPEQMKELTDRGLLPTVSDNGSERERKQS